MGTTVVDRIAPAMPEAALKDWVREEAERQQHERGHDAYAGTWTPGAGLHIVRESFDSLAKARAFADSHAEKRGPVIAVRVGDHNQAFPALKADKALVERHEQTHKDFTHFDFEVFQRTRGQKSEKKTCGHCASSINVKRLPNITRNEFDRALNNGSGYYGMSSALCDHRGKVLLPTFMGLTDCPVCGHNLMYTETDIKRKKALGEKASELGAKVHAAKQAHAARIEKLPVKPCWLLLAHCAT